MFGKSDSGRIEETLAFIQGQNFRTPNIRNEIVDWVRTTFNRATTEQKNLFHQISTSMSVKTRLGKNVLITGDETQRKQRRAIFLLWAATYKGATVVLNVNQGVSTYTDADEAMTMPLGSLSAKLTRALETASLVGSPFVISEKFEELISRPVTFIRSNKIFIAGSIKNAELFQQGSQGPYRNKMAFYFQFDPFKNQFNLSSKVNVPGFTSRMVETVSVPAVHWSKLPGSSVQNPDLTKLLGCELTDADFMVTTQFTGCSFVWTNYNNTVRAIHVSPGGAPFYRAAPALATDLVNNGAMQFSGNTPLSVFGCGAGNAVLPNKNAPALNYYPVNIQGQENQWKGMFIFGVKKRLEENWRFYTQLINMDGTIRLNQTGRIF